MYLRQEQDHVLLPCFRCVGDPAMDGLKRSALLSDVKLVPVQDGTQFLHRELPELLSAKDLLEFIQDKLVSLELQLRTQEEVGELPDANAVLWAELLLQEVAAGVYNGHYEELVGCQEQLLHVATRHRYSAGVRKLYDELHHVRGQIQDLKGVFVWTWTP